MRVEGVAIFGAGLCACGCGGALPVRLERVNPWSPLTIVKLTYLRGHHRRKSSVDYLLEDRGHTTLCWIWQGASDGRYGVIDGQKAHRRYYEHFKGPIPVGLELDHLCRETMCVNSDHLEAVTHAENMRRYAIYAQANATPFVMPETKICTKCSVEKMLEDFSILKSSRDGRYPSCKKCKREQQAERKKQLVTIGNHTGCG